MSTHDNGSLSLQIMTTRNETNKYHWNDILLETAYPLVLPLHSCEVVAALNSMAGSRRRKSRLKHIKHTESVKDVQYRSGTEKSFKTEPSGYRPGLIEQVFHTLCLILGTFVEYLVLQPGWMHRW